MVVRQITLCMVMFQFNCEVAVLGFPYEGWLCDSCARGGFFIAVYAVVHCIPLRVTVLRYDGVAGCTAGNWFGCYGTKLVRGGEGYGAELVCRGGCCCTELAYGGGSCWTEGVCWGSGYGIELVCAGDSSRSFSSGCSLVSLRVVVSHLTLCVDVHRFSWREAVLCFPLRVAGLFHSLCMVVHRVRLLGAVRQNSLRAAVLRCLCA
jgi:hypothetical protein